MNHAASQPDRKVLELLAAARKQSPPAPQAVEADDYDWSCPCRFTASQRQKLKRLTGRAATEISVALSEQIHDGVELSPGQISQSYARQLAVTDGQEADRYLSVMSEDGSQCGFVVIPAEQARRWVAKVLGGTLAETAEKQLSVMETALLTDVVAAGVQALGRVVQQAGGKALRCGEDVPTIAELLSDEPSDEPSDEYTLLPFCGVGQDQAVVLTFVLASDTVSPIVDPTDESTLARSAEGIRKDLLASIEQVSVTCDIVLATASPTMRDIANLQEGDVLLVDKMVGEPVQLAVGGRAILSGYPVRCNGQYALQIAGPGRTASFGTQYQDE